MTVQVVLELESAMLEQIYDKDLLESVYSARLRPLWNTRSSKAIGKGDNCVGV